MLSNLTPLTNTIASWVQDLTWPEFGPEDARTLVVFTLFCALFALEVRCAYRKQAPVLVRQSYFTNLGAFILNDTLMSLLSVSSLYLIAERYAESGLLSGISNPLAQALGFLLLLDLALYCWHRLNHRVDALWMLHRVHHSDPCMNVSTAFRLHGGEVFLTTLVKAGFIVLAGVDTTVLLATEAIITLCVMFHHANVTFRGERRLGGWFVMPYLHRTHHSAMRCEHDRNYGAVFSVWDRLFGTFTEREPSVLGLRQVSSQNLIDLVKFGLTRVSPPQPQALTAMIAEAAYFRAERRGFAPGDDFTDWLEAEKEILGTAAAVCTRKSRRIPDWKMLPALLLGRFAASLRTSASSCHS